MKHHFHVYTGNGFEGRTIVNYGLALNVAQGKAIVEYNGESADFYEVLKTKTITGRRETISLDADQLEWLEDSKTWVKHQIEERV